MNSRTRKMRGGTNSKELLEIAEKIINMVNKDINLEDIKNIYELFETSRIKPEVQPTPVEPTPVEPTPVQPPPVQPTPVQPPPDELQFNLNQLNNEITNKLSDFNNKYPSNEVINEFYEQMMLDMSQKKINLDQMSKDLKSKFYIMTYLKNKDEPQNVELDTIYENIDNMHKIYYESILRTLPDDINRDEGLEFIV